MQFETCTEGSVPEALLDQATMDISNHLISFCVDDRSSGSASLATIDGHYGFLTAAHVVDDLYDSRLSHIAIVYAEHPCQLLLDKQHISRVQYGPSEGEFPGPDLAFIHVHDPNCINTLKEKKLFYCLRDSSAPLFEQMKGKFSPVCLIAGAPDEMSREEGARRTRSHLLVRKHFFARAQFSEEISRGGFDYLKFSSFADKHGFPASYNGTSGGGVWHVPLCQDPDIGITSLKCEKPELIGVVFFESGLVNHSRVVWTHSHRSFYSSLRRAAVL
jgi:hypothetical protein